MFERLKLPLLCAVLMLGLFIYSTGQVKADLGGGREKIYACRILASDHLRQVDEPDDCIDILESPVEWRVGPEDGTEFPFICQDCILHNMPIFSGRDLRNAWLRSSILNESSFEAVNFTGANLSNIDAHDTIFTSSTLVDVDFSDADLEGAIGMGSTTRSGIIWSYTICPDGTNSDENSFTCEGHF